MIKLSELEIEFLEKELQITVEDLETMYIADWQQVREACYDIVLDEMLDENDEYREEGDGSERCSIASNLMETKFKELKG